METIGERIEKVIEVKGVKKTQFAREIGVSVQAVYLFTSGQRNPSEQTIRMISRVYGIREEWLLTGIGSMTSSQTVQQEIADIVAKLSENTDPFIIAMLGMILEMDSSQREKLKWKIKEIASRI